MKLPIVRVVVAFLPLVLSLTPTTLAQSSAQTASALPRLVRFGGTAKDLNGNPLTGVVGITFALYSEQTGGAPLWLETQNVTADSTGHYTALLGATKPEGLPTDLFTSEQARWVGVQVSGQAEQPRVLLVSAPYALKAGDAETIGGLSPSAFMLAAPPSANAAAASNDTRAASVSPATTSDVTTTGGTASTFPLFTTATNIQNSILTQTSTTAINVLGKLNFPALGTAKASAGFNSRPQDFVASVFNSSTAKAVPQTFQWQAEALNNDKSTATGTLNLLYASGTATPAETGLHIASTGLITFATGQTFPGTGNGTITGVTAGTDLTGGGTTGSVTLSLDTTKVPQLAANNTFTGLQTVKTSSGAAGVTVQNSDASAGLGLEATAYVGIKSTGTEYGIQGMTTSGKAGIYGSIQGGNTNRDSGYENGNAGVWGDTGGGPGTYIGVLGTANETAGGVFDNNSQGDSYAALFAQNDTASNPSAAVISTLGSTYDGICNIDVSGNLSCSGTISGSNIAADRRVLRTYAVQAAENWYEDAGSGQLQSGSARVALEANFAAVVNSEVDYHVFLTPEGDCKGLYVSHKTETGFEVRELGGGASNVAFDYRIMAKRKGFEKLRMEDVTLRERKQAEQRPNFRRRVATASVSPASSQQAALKK
jgi:hypothetical protein